MRVGRESRVIPSRDSMMKLFARLPVTSMTPEHVFKVYGSERPSMLKRLKKSGGSTVCVLKVLMLLVSQL